MTPREIKNIIARIVHLLHEIRREDPTNKEKVYTLDLIEEYITDPDAPWFPNEEEDD